MTGCDKNGGRKMDFFIGVLGYTVKALLMTVAIIAGVFAGKKVRDMKDAKQGR